MDDPSPTATKRRWFKFTRRDGWWLAGFAVFGLAALAVWKPLRHELVMSLALRSDGPSDSILSGLVEEAPNRAQTLERMWRSGNLTARLFVMEYLMAHRPSEPALVTQMEAVVKEAARDADIAVRERALHVLAQEKRPECLALLRDQLQDADPAMRVLALRQLHHIGDSNDVPTAIRLLDDADPRVIVSAAVLLRRVTGLDFGIKTSRALPQFTRSDGQPPATPNLEAIQQGVQQWQDWWGRHRAEFPERPRLPHDAVPAWPVKDFGLEDLDGRLVRLSDLRGKTVLLCFWNITKAASFDDLAVLNQLQTQQPQSLAVLAVAFDPAVGPQNGCCGEEHDGGHEPQPGHAHSSPASLGPAAIKSAVRDLVARMNVTHPVLVDPKGFLVFRFNVQEVPTYVLIDAQGNLRRRFAGSRSAAVFQAMMDEAGVSSGGSRRPAPQME